MFGKLENGNLVIAGRRIKNGKGGEITNPTTEDLIANGYKVVEYTEKPTFDKEEKKLYEVYNETTDKIIVNYETRILTDEEHNEIIKQEIEAEENKITARNIRNAILGDNFAKNRITEIENNIYELRAKLREIQGEE